MPIPISALVQVLPGTITAAGSAADIVGLFITDSQKIPGGAVKAYSSLPDVSEDFSTTDKEYLAAQTYFNSYENSTQKPARILFAMYNTVATPAILTGGNLGNTTVDDIAKLTGDLSVIVSGKTLTADALSFDDVKTMADVASAIQTALDPSSAQIKIEFNSTSADFTVTTVTAGAVSTITAMTGSLAAPLKLDETVATVSQGTSPQTPGDFMNGIVKINRNWGTFTTLYASTVADKMAFSAWSNSQNNRFCYVDREAPSEDSDDWSDTWCAQIQANKSSGIACIYEVEDGKPLFPAFVMGCAASLDFNRLNGRTTFAYRTQPGLVASDMDQSFYNKLTEAGYNVYANFAATKENFNFLQPGSISGQFKWLDTFINQIWLNANLQLQTVYVLKDNPLLPYNRIGYSKFIVAWQGQCDKAVNYGMIQTGVTLDPGQLQQVETAVGFDVSDALMAKGYYIDLKDAPASVRIARGSPSASLYYVDGGSIQQMTLASIAIL